MRDRVMLAPLLYKDVSKINADITEKHQNSIKLIRITNKDKSEGVRKFTGEFLTFVGIADLPPHELTIKNNKNIILLRNLDVSKGLCNGARFIVEEICNRIIKAKLIIGEYSSRVVHIPRISFRFIGKLVSTM